MKVLSKRYKIKGYNALKLIRCGLLKFMFWKHINRNAFESFKK